MPLSFGEKLGPYEILTPIGAGGMGEVYRAKDTKLGREVAIKVLPAAFAQHLERLARFERGAKVLASLNHPNIAQIYGLEESSSGRALVMELVQGENLKGPLPFQTALTCAKQIAEALEAAHEKGIVHRDLKPANVMVTHAGVVKVLDFGLAKVSDEADNRDDSSSSSTFTLTVTRAGTIMGTAAYMSPEQAQGADADPRADIWSFGALLFEMLSGKRAFTGKSVSDILVAVLRNEPDWSALPAQTPAAVRQLLRQCLRKERKQRLQAIGDARIAIEEVMAGGIKEDASGRTMDTGRSVLPWAAGAGVLAIVAAIGWWMAWQSTGRVDRPMMRLSVDLGPDAIFGGNMTAAISPDGTRLVFLVHGPEGKTQLATRLLDETQVTVLSGTEDAYDPFFKPDGEWIGFFAEGMMKRVSIRGGSVITVCVAPGGRGAAWGEDDNIIATLDASTGTGLSRVPAAGGTPQAITNPGEKGEATHRWPQIPPGGEAVVFTGNKMVSNYDDSSIEVLSLKTGQLKVVQPGGYFGRYVATSKGRGYLVYIHQRTLFGVPFDLDRMEVRGTPAPLLDDVAGNSQTAGGQFDFSRNGTLVYLGGKASSGTWTVAWLDRDGKTQPLLGPGNYYQPRLSPDGKSLAFSNGTDIETYEWERGARGHLNFKGPATNYVPVWTPDGKHIVFQSQGTGSWSLQWMRADGAGVPQLLWGSRNRVAPYSFSFDGKRLAFSEQSPDMGWDLWTMSLDTRDPEHPKTGTPEPFLRTPADEEYPAFSPDGRWIAYTSNQSGHDEVYVRPFPPGSGQKTISTGGGQFPMWSSESLFYLGPDNRIMTAAYTAKGDALTAEAPRLWSKTQTSDVDPNTDYPYLDRAPDGKRFVVSRSPEAQSGGAAKVSVHVTFVLNFFDEVRRRVPTGK